MIIITRLLRLLFLLHRLPTVRCKRSTVPLFVSDANIQRLVDEAFEDCVCVCARAPVTHHPCEEKPTRAASVIELCGTPVVLILSALLEKGICEGLEVPKGAGKYYNVINKFSALRLGQRIYGTFVPRAPPVDRHRATVTHNQREMVRQQKIKKKSVP